jgi:hypothetical protein
MIVALRKGAFTRGIAASALPNLPRQTVRSLDLQSLQGDKFCYESGHRCVRAAFWNCSCTPLTAAYLVGQWLAVPEFASRLSSATPKSADGVSPVIQNQGEPAVRRIAVVAMAH